MHTLAQARTLVQGFLDDDGTRWTTTEIDIALQAAIDSTVREYVAAGGSRFDTTASLSSTVAGVVTPAVAPIVMRGLTMVVGSRHFPLTEISPEERNVLDDSIRSYLVRYVPTYTLPTTTSHPLVGSGATQAPGTWDALEKLMCIRAALLLATKDADARQDLVAQESHYRDIMMVDPPTPKSARFPGPARWYSALFAWYWRPDLNAIQIVRRT